ncbi:mannose-1-phosphate guanylyltransferase/mannose-6-phosphate isomerase [Xylophilus ampelinus]|uniref:mannose-1-phosphate guanylyltransferase n=1 Tax=Xylophilus ampelinus TaxID=54067 RepID=A0A318SN42_9BURK|nr:mannose-1-phosphate guanylyltransferase/mannose-6-phosphate isomerase [Xylophilus ampelinus]
MVLCGGSGSRLWPLSRESQPKQFLALTGAETMLQQTVRRTDGLPPSEVVVDSAPIVVCNEAHRFMAAQQLAAVGVRTDRILLESGGRNTAPALTLAALLARREDADPLLLVMPADHAVADVPGLQAAVLAALDACASGAMCTFGVVPVRPETGYGYIRRGAAHGGGLFGIASFAEKPDSAHAQQYLASGEYLWNSGMFMVRSSVWLAAIARYRADISEACIDAMAAAAQDGDFVRPDAQAWSACPSDSIDYAVMERLPRNPELGIAARVVPLDAGWSDVGAWDALWQLRPHDPHGNARVGDTLMLHSTDCLVMASGRLVAGIGLRNLVIVETPDAVLVADKTRVQEVRDMVAQLKASGHASANTHRKVQRPWGWYDSIDQGERFQVKRIVVHPGASLSLQLHHHRAEHWVVVKGIARITNGDRAFVLRENESTYIPRGHKHRLANPGPEPLEIIEVQSGDYLGEDDIVRFEDDYDRMA